MLSSIRTLRLCDRSTKLCRFARVSQPHRGWTPAITWRHLQSRKYADVATQVKQDEPVRIEQEGLVQIKQENPAQLKPRESAKIPDKPQQRFNELGVQQLSRHVHEQIFFKKAIPPPPEYIELAEAHLTRHELLGKNNDNNPPICFDLPPIQGASKTMDEHFWRLGMDAAEPYLSFANKFANLDLPPPPEKWVKQSGWTRYKDGKTEAIVAPNDEEMLVFDVEVLYKISPFAVMACAASPTAWYAWISPWVLGDDKSDRHLIPLGDAQKQRIIVGHNVGYDRSRILEEYSLEQSKFSFLDTMSLHVAANGMCSRQRPTWIKHRKIQKLRDEGSPELAALLQPELEDERWVERSSINSLLEVARFHCGIDIDKGIRDQFGILDREGCKEKLDELLTYCASDVAVTHQVYKQVLPGFLEVCPHPVSFAALRQLSSVILPVNRSWETYINDAEKLYKMLSNCIFERLVVLADKALELKDNPEAIAKDQWLRQLDWSGQEIKMVKGRKKGDPPRPAARQKKPGMPKWYKALFPKSASTEPHLSVRTRISPILLRLMWDGKPLVWSTKFGWVFGVPNNNKDDYKDSPVVKCDMSMETDLKLKDDHENVYFKLPHNDGPAARCVSPLTKSYLKYFEEGILTSEFPLAKEALEMNASCSYWISARQRIKGQMVVYDTDIERINRQIGEGKGAEGQIMIDKSNSKDLGAETQEVAETTDSTEEKGFILPQIIPMGTVTRRAVESCWLTASNAKKNRVGSELKAMVKAPPGFVFVGSDVDSQELWIASLVGDAQFKLHGGNAIGFMTLEGTRAAGTDLHSKTAKILGISRNHAKVFNYGRIYGAGVKFASTLLRQFNPSLSEAEAVKVAENLYRETKGQKTCRRQLNDGRPFWRGGTESYVFNKLEHFANEETPKTPVLGAGITEALRREYLSKNGFLPSRINWAIQSSGVDYLHLLIISMDHLIRRFNLNARLAITVHDEIRYLVKEEDKYKTAMALQVANVWTRAMFSQQMGIEDLPQSCAYFSAVDIDSVLRKEVDMTCITPSNPVTIPPGESIDIINLLKREDSILDLAVKPREGKIDYDRWEYTPRMPVMEELQKTVDIPFLKAQSATDEEFSEIMREIAREARVKQKRPAVSTPSIKTPPNPPKPPKPSNFTPQESTRLQQSIFQKYTSPHIVWSFQPGPISKPNPLKNVE